jgi:non-heme chloroperoxidase
VRWKHLRAVIPAVLAAVAAWLARLVLRSRRRLHANDPCGPAGTTLPVGRYTSVTTDDGAVLDVTVAGPREGPTAVLVHCWTGSKRVWAAVARQLMHAGYRVVLYDQRGHGASTAGAGIDSIDRLGRDLLAVLDELDIRDAVLVGHSMGGMAVQAFAVNHPDARRARVRGVVLVATAAHVLGRPVPAELVDRVIGDGRLEWTRRGRLGSISARAAVGRHAYPAHIALTADGMRNTDGAARVACLRAMTAMDLRDGLGAIDEPVTVLVGTWDRLTSLRRARVIASRLPNAELRVLRGIGHMVPLESPDSVVEAVVEMTAAPRSREGVPA